MKLLQASCFISLSSLRPKPVTAACALDCRALEKRKLERYGASGEGQA